MTPLFPYPGQKSSDYDLLSEIIVCLKSLQSKDSQYREPFLGAGGVFLNLASSLPDGQAVWLNDLDSSLICLWKMVWKRPEDLIREAKRQWNPTETVFDIFNRWTKNGFNPDGDEDNVLHHAVAKLIRQHFARDGGKERTFSKEKKLFSPVEETIHSAHRQLKRFNLRLTAVHFREVIAPSDKAVIYADPTYFKKGHKNYRKYMIKREHQELRDLLLFCPNPWLLSYDDCPEIRSLYEIITRIPVMANGREALAWTPGKTKEWLSLRRRSPRNNKTYRELLLTMPEVSKEIERRLECTFSD